MADDDSAVGLQDHRRIDVSQDSDLEYWSKSFGVTPEELKRAVGEAGTWSDDVQRALRNT